MAKNKKEPKVPPDAPRNDSSEALNDLLFMALDHAVDCVTTGENLIPFILAEDAHGYRMLQRFHSDRLEWSVGQAKAEAASLSPEILRYALAYDAFVTVAGERYDTVVVEAGERGAGPGWSLGQRYRKETSSQHFEIVGNPLHLGSVEDRFERSA